MNVEFDEENTNRYASYANDTEATGIIGFLISKGIVKDEDQARMVLLGVAVLAGALAIYLFVQSGKPAKSLAPTAQTSSTAGSN